jgi:hypothetical protein
VQKERDAKERTKREREAREAAERALAAQERPWDIGAQMPRISDFIGTGSILGSLSAEPPEHLLRLAGMEPPKPPEPLSEEEIQQKVAEIRSRFEARWPSCRDYLSSVAFPALRLRIANNAESFLTNVQVSFTFHGARGIRFKGLSAYQFQKVQDPSWQPQSDPRLGYVPPPPLALARPADYPIEWRHNDDGDLVVTVTLPQLRPHPEWRSEHHGDDIVVVLDPDAEANEITVTYTATAQGYGKPFIGDPFRVPVERADMRDVLKATHEAASKAS